MRCYVGPEGRDAFLLEPAGQPVIVDVLRATSTIVAALFGGAARVIPVADYAEGLALGRRLGALLIGERSGVRVEGFAYNNSPTVVMGLPLRGRTIVMVTTNGTKVMAEGGIVASTLNAGAVAEAIARVPHAYLLASGAPARSDEDRCAATLIELVAEAIAAGQPKDEAVRSATSGPGGAACLECIRRSGSGEKLTAYGYGADVDLVCSAVGRFPVLPVYRRGEIRLQ